VILNLATGDYHSLDAMGSAFLTALRRNRDVESARDELAASHDVDPGQLAEDMREFCSRLMDRGLIEVRLDDDA
jgi:hypothetical protein